MRILLGHARYASPGGEDLVFEWERDLLVRHGHQVVEFVVDNRDLVAQPRWTVAAETLWSIRSRRRLSRVLCEAPFDIAHFHNLFPQLSPSVYYACADAGVPVVQTLHNYRVICPVATLHRDGRVCTDCLGKTPPWPGVVHGCYRGSRLDTMGIAAMITLHRWLGSWREKVDLFIAPTKSAGLLLASGGVPMERLRIRPNFLPADPGRRTAGGDFALFVGRLSSEKGLAVLLEAWRSLPHIPLKIVGSGPLGDTIARRLARDNLTSVEILGQLPHEDVLRLMKSARMLVVPSVWYEVFALTIVEAFACALPVVGSDIGSVGEIVEHGRTGRLFEVGNAEALALEARGMWSDSQEARRMGAEARSTFLDKYTGERVYPQLQDIYDEARSRPSKMGARRRDEIAGRGSGA